MNALFRRVAEALGWTNGQVWTVAVGLAIALPAALFGLGPSVQLLRNPPAAAATPAPVARAPAILSAAPETATPAPAGAVSVPSGTATSPAIAAAPSGSGASAPSIIDGVFASIAGPGQVRALAVAADAVVVAVDAGDGTAGRIVVLDAAGNVAHDVSLVVNNVPHEHPGGVSVSDQGVLVTTAAPSAVLRVDPVEGTVTKVADVPDVPLCLGPVRSTDCQVAVPDSAPAPQHIAVAETGDIFVADRGQACIFRVEPGKTIATAWLCDLSFASAPAAADGGLAGIAVAGTRLVFTVGGGFDGSNSVQELAITNGAPGARTTLAAPSTRPGGVAILSDGRVLVALIDGNGLLLIASDGASRTANMTGLTGPVDVDVLDDTVFVADRVDPDAARVSRRSLSAL